MIRAEYDLGGRLACAREGLKLKNRSETAGFVPFLGPVYDYPPYRRLAPPAHSIRLNHSGIDVTPYWIPATWRLHWINQPSASQTSFRIRCLIHGHGLWTIALYGQITSEHGIPFSELTGHLRGLSDDRSHDPALFSIRTANNEFDGSVEDIFKLAAVTMSGGLLSTDTQSSSADLGVSLSKDHLLVDLGRTSPQIAMPAGDKELGRLLQLDMDPKRVVRDLREESLGWYEGDWIGANSRRLLFCDSGTPWPSESRRQRTLRRRATVVWRLASTAQLVQAQELWLRYLTQLFESLSLEMLRAQNRSDKFLATLLRHSFYDDRLVTLAIDLPKMKSGLYARDADLFEYLAARSGHADLIEQFQSAEAELLRGVQSWKPGIAKLLDLVKLFPGSH